ncbi:uncharacterized protein METZ01_LOCUS144977 [marine metagenome]|uniref:Uncharacterized protein n=1 Tax=marine metagenome TaxID=408172 RepID=A0A381ZTP1_9ZZZZ
MRSKLSFSAKIIVLNRKLGPSLGSPFVDNFSTCLGRHARSKAVGSFSFYVAGLICSFHCWSKTSFKNNTIVPVISA